MNVATVTPGAMVYARHDGLELNLYILQGRVRHISGENLAKAMDNEW